MQSWREDQKALTRSIIRNVDVVAFCFSLTGINKGCTLDHLDGRFGYITLEDALADCFRVYDYESETLQETYATLEELIEDGWKVST
ncbi:hypothetical protein SDC9_120113 [bioreactor metagenome]|jgi:hypothetical protein|uniref:Uncharacterized protein n=1 Tax=bioreactor metagenome TaxID=1076179 RepID=A0A645C7I5_9ZZZZ|nr:hypothetical protein [Sphaerochaeta sp.]